MIDTPGMSHFRPQAVVALVSLPDETYLLIKRAPEIPGGGHWSPVSGKPEARESLQEAAVREVSEEVGLVVHAREEVHRCMTSDGSYDLVWFRCEVDAASEPHALSLDFDEVSAAGWFSPEEALELTPMFEATRRFFATLLPQSVP